MDTTLTSIAIHGAAGRMGRRLIDLAGADASVELVAALEHGSHEKIGCDSGEIAGCGVNGVLLASDLGATQPQAVIDFSLPDAVPAIVELCLAKGLPLVVATTGFGDSVKGQLTRASARIPLVWAPNMSLAVNLGWRLAETAAAALAQSAADVDVEILETHHRFKADAPSGTALKFGQVISSKLGLSESVHGRCGETGARPRNEIGYHAVRAGDDAGQHTVLFGMLGEKIEVHVAASNRDCYARGAILAAKFAAQSAPGLYDMQDVLGLRDHNR